MKNFTSAPTKKSDPIDFSLDGENYTFTPLKTSTMLVGMLELDPRSDFKDMERVGPMLAWFFHGLNLDHVRTPGRDGHDDAVKDCQACRIEARLADPRDELEFDTVLEVTNWLMSESSGRPTT